MANIRKRPTRIIKYLTIGASTLGVVSSGSFAVLMGINAAKGDFITEDLREYTATFSNEGTILSSKTYNRGDEIQTPDAPSHSIDGQNNYFFIGWDTTGNGLPDIIPPRIYYSFHAEAVYFKTGQFDLSWLDITNMDLEQLLELMDMLNLDWEQLMDMFGIDLEQLMELLNKPVITFEADESQYISYFRATSFGDFNYNTKKYANPNFYDSSRIRAGSVNPLSYTADKLNTAYNLTDALPETFDFINYDITFLAPSEYYAVPDCEHNDETNDIVDSDAHYVKVPEDLKYQTRAAYVPAMSTVIEMLGMVPYSNNNITKDEKEYRQYAYDNYTTIPQEYEKVIDQIIKVNKWQPDDYSQIDSIGAYIERLGRCSLFNEEGEFDLAYKKNDDPVFGLIDNKAGTDEDFNTVAVMVCRRLGIPARMVKGYVVPQIKKGTNTISFLNQHWWCEIYVKKIGWMIFDCMNAEQFLGTNPYGDLDKDSTPLEDKHILESIKVTPPNKTVYQLGDDLNLTGAYIMAHFEDSETDERVGIRSSGVQVTGFDSSQIGECTVTVSYTYHGVTKTDTFTVTIKERTDIIERVEFITTDARTWYYEDEEFDLSGITATGICEDGTEVPLSDQIGFSGYEKVKGEYTVTLFVENTATSHLDFADKSTKINVTVYKKRVDAINITPPAKTTYYAGEPIDYSGLVVEFVYYNNNTEIMHAGDYNISAVNMNEIGEHTITISYVNDREGNLVSNSFTINVLSNNMTGLSVDGVKTEYIVTEPFDEHEFFKNATAYISREHTVYEEININDVYVIEEPDLSHTGYAFCTLGYTDKGIEKTVLVTIHVVSLGGYFNITYPSTNYDVDYDAKTHGNRINYTVQVPENFPSFLSYQIEFTSTNPDTGADVLEHSYVPVLKIYNSYNDVDVTSLFSYSIGGGASGVTFCVNPIATSIKLTPTGGLSHSKGTSFGIEVTATGLAAGDYAVFEGSVSYAYVGTYSNYLDFGNVVIYNKNGQDVTDCYYISEYEYDEVVITDQL